MIDFSGRILWTETDKVQIPPNTSTLIHSFDESSLPAGDRPGSIFLVTDLELDGEVTITNNLYFTSPKYLELTDTEIKLTLNRNRGGYTLELESDKLVRNLYLQTGDAGATYSDNFFDLLPGKKKTVQIVTTKDINDHNEITMVSLNDLKHRR